jgi:hypothetical protein
VETPGGVSTEGHPTRHRAIRSNLFAACSRRQKGFPLLSLAPQGPALRAAGVFSLKAALSATEADTIPESAPLFLSIRHVFYVWFPVHFFHPQKGRRVKSSNCFFHLCSFFFIFRIVFWQDIISFPADGNCLETEASEQLYFIRWGFNTPPLRAKLDPQFLKLPCISSRIQEKTTKDHREGDRKKEHS